jgi:hypothetical protein
MILDLDLEAKLLDQARKSGNSESAINELIDFYLNEKAPKWPLLTHGNHHLSPTSKTTAL